MKLSSHAQVKDLSGKVQYSDNGTVFQLHLELIQNLRASFCEISLHVITQGSLNITWRVAVNESGTQPYSVM